MPLTPTTVKHGRVDLQSLNCHDIYHGKDCARANIEGKSSEVKKLPFRQFKKLHAENL